MLQSERVLRELCVREGAGLPDPAIIRVLGLAFSTEFDILESY